MSCAAAGTFGGQVITLRSRGQSGNVFFVSGFDNKLIHYRSKDAFFPSSFMGALVERSRMLKHLDYFLHDISYLGSNERQRCIETLSLKMMPDPYDAFAFNIV